MQDHQMTYIKDVLETRELLPVSLREMVFTTPMPGSVGEVIDGIFKPLMTLKTMIFRPPSSWHLGNESSCLALCQGHKARYDMMELLTELSRAVHLGGKLCGLDLTAVVMVSGL